MLPIVYEMREKVAKAVMRTIAASIEGVVVCVGAPSRSHSLFSTHKKLYGAPRGEALQDTAQS